MATQGPASSPMASNAACMIPYPERYYKAVEFVEHPSNAEAVRDDALLLLYALNQQATVGPCNEPKPWSWNVVETAKWQSWRSLAGMSKMEAMRLFVRTLEEEQADWWKKPLEAVKADAGAGGGAAGAAAVERPPSDWAGYLKAGAWVQLPEPACDRKPAPRYEHGAAVLDGRLYVLGGNYAGRYLSDAWRFELKTQQWVQCALTPGAGSGAAAAVSAEGQSSGAAAEPPCEPAFPPCAGFSVTQYRGQLYILGGHVRSRGGSTGGSGGGGGGGASGAPAAAMQVRRLDPATLTITTLATSGVAPLARGGHSAVLLGSRVYIFGGEDTGRRSLGDLHVLDLETLAWSQPAAKGAPPAPRSAHSACGWAGRFMLVFGGGSVATCYQDLRALDTVSMEWSRVGLAAGSPSPSPRAGHAGAMLGSTWYIVGGGNNVKGCTEMLALDLRSVGPESDIRAAGLKWATVATIPLRDPLSSEGMAVLAVPGANALLAFGGYNGKYQQGISVFQPAAPQEAPAAAASTPAAAASPAPALGLSVPKQQEGGGTPAERKELASPSAAAAMRGWGLPSASTSSSDASATIAALRQEVEAARKAAAAAVAEASSAKAELAKAQATIAELTRRCEEAQAALHAEQSNRRQLEAQLTRQISGREKEGQGQLPGKAQSDQMLAEEEAGNKKAAGGGGLWGFVTGRVN